MTESWPHSTELRSGRACKRRVQDLNNCEGCELASDMCSLWESHWRRSRACPGLRPRSRPGTPAQLRQCMKVTHDGVPHMPTMMTSGIAQAVSGHGHRPAGSMQLQPQLKLDTTQIR